MAGRVWSGVNMAAAQECLLSEMLVRVRVRVSVGEAAGVLERGGHGVSNDVDGHVSQLIVLDALRLHLQVEVMGAGVAVGEAALAPPAQLVGC